MDVLRKIIFYLFFVLYLFILPFVLLYSLGYIFPPFGKTFEKAGVLFVDTVPKEVTLFLGGRKFKDQTPSEIRPLLPGDYQITLKKKGYQSWSSWVHIQAGQVTRLDPVILLPDEIKEKEILTFSFETLTPLPQIEGMLLSKRNSLESASIFYLNEEVLIPLFAATEKREEKNIFSKVYQADKNPNIILLLKGLFFNESFCAVRTEKEGSQPVDLLNLIPSKLTYLGLPMADSPLVFTVSEETVQKIDIEKRVLYPDFVKEVAGFGVGENFAYFFDPQFNLYQIDFDGQKQTLLFDDSEMGETLFKNEGFIEIIPLTKEHFLFKTEKNRLITNVAPYHLGNFSVVGHQYYPDKKFLLVWDRTSLGGLFFQSLEKETFFQRIPKVSWFYRGHPNALQQCFLVPETKYCILTDAGKIYLLENLIPGKTKLYPLKEKRKDSRVYFDEKHLLVYYLDAKSGCLSAIGLSDKMQ